MTAEEIIHLLELTPLEPEGGFFRRIWYSSAHASAPPEGKAKHYRTGSAIYYLMTRDNISRLHSLKSTELWHFYQGDPVELTLFPRDDQDPHSMILGQNLLQGQRPFYTVPGGTVFGASLYEGGEWALLGNCLTPSFEEEDFCLEDPEELKRLFPEWKERIQELGGI